MKKVIYSVNGYTYLVKIDRVFVITPFDIGQWFAPHYVSFEYVGKQPVEIESLPLSHQELIKNLK